MFNKVILMGEELNQSELERLKRYIEECTNCSDKGLEAHISNLQNILNKYPPDKIKKLMRLFKALGNDVRIKILLLLRDKELNKEKVCACEINVVLGLSQSNISHHLNILEQMGLIINNTQGKWKYYQITDRGKEMIQLLE